MLHKLVLPGPALLGLSGQVDSKNMTRSGNMRIGKRRTKVDAPKDDFATRLRQSAKDKQRALKCSTGSRDLNAGSASDTTGSSTKVETNVDASSVGSGNTQP